MWNKALNESKQLEGRKKNPQFYLYPIKHLLRWREECGRTTFILFHCIYLFLVKYHAELLAKGLLVTWGMIHSTINQNINYG